MFPKAREVKCLKRRKRMLIDVLYHKFINMKVHLVVLKAYLVNIGEFLSTFAHKQCMIFGNFLIWSKMFPGYPKCSPAPPVVPACFLRSATSPNLTFFPDDLIRIYTYISRGRRRSSCPCLCHHHHPLYQADQGGRRDCGREPGHPHELQGGCAQYKSPARLREIGQQKYCGANLVFKS